MSICWRSLALKCFQKMGRFPKASEVSESVVEHVRRCLELDDRVLPVYASTKTRDSHRVLVRRLSDVVHNPGKARKVAQRAIWDAAWVKNHPPDLINVALEKLTQACLELPAFSTLDAMESRIRGEVNAQICKRIWVRLGPDGRGRLEALLVAGPDGKSDLQRLNQAAGRATWTKFKAQAEHLEWVKALGDMSRVLEGIAASKIADFAGEAHAADADVLRRVYASEPKRLALLACLLHTAQAQARDDLTLMMCKRMAVNVRKAKLRLEEIHQRQREVTERLLSNYRQVLGGLSPSGAAGVAQATATQLLTGVMATMPPAGDDADPVERSPAEQAAVVDALLNAVRMQSAGMGAVHKMVEEGGGFEGQLASIEEVTAYQGNNHELLIADFFKSDRSTMFALAGALEFEATSEDHSVLDALDHALAHWSGRREFIPDHVGGIPVDLSFVSVNWRRAIRDREHPGMLVKRHFEAMCFAYLAEELRTGDVAVCGGADYGDWSQHLLTFDECRPLLAGFCEEAGLPAGAASFVAELTERHARAATDLDAGYAGNEDLSFGKDGEPTLRRTKGKGTSAEAVKLGEEIKKRIPERTLIEILARTAYWLGWWRHFGPVSGKDPKLADPQDRYVLTTFACGSNMGAAEAARHIAGITAHEISLTKNRHVTLAKLNKAIAEVVNAFTKLDVVKAWGDGKAVGTDGTQVDTYIDNLLAESHIRYGGFGGIAYHYVSNNYIAIFSRFVPCGAWEAIYIIDGLLANASELKPKTVHADTQGQSFPVFTLAHLFGFDLMPRIRNWKGLTYFQHSDQARYSHIDALFTDASGGRHVIDWKLITKMWPDLMRVAISIKEGRLNSVTLLRRLGSHSRKNEIYKAFREVGRSVRTVALLRYLADPALRKRVTAVTNQVEAYNGFSGWLRFGNGGVLTANDPAEQEKMIKFNTLLANCVVFHTALDMTDILRELVAEGWEIKAETIGELSPYINEHIARFGVYATDVLKLRPMAFDPELAEVDFDTLADAA